MRLAALFLVVVCACLVSAQNDGRYKPIPTRIGVNPFGTNRFNSQANFGQYSGGSSQYRGGGDGKYRPDNDGKYRGSSDGKYRGGNDGKYVHVDNPYDHIDVAGGDYSGDANPYKHVGGAGGNYQGDNDKYKGDQYKGDQNKQKGFGSGNPFGGAASGFGSNSGAGAKLNSGFGSGSGSGAKFGAGFGSGAHASSGPVQIVPDFADASGKSTLGVPQGLKQGNAAGLYDDNRTYGIIKKIEKVEEDGYHYIYETENKILAEEQGRIENRGKDEEGMRASGFFLYTGPDGIEYKVTYTADERGFIPEAAHIPTPPPVPPLIAKMLEYKRSIGEI